MVSVQLIVSLAARVVGVVVVVAIHLQFPFMIINYKNLLRPLLPQFTPRLPMRTPSGSEAVGRFGRNREEFMAPHVIQVWL